MKQDDVRTGNEFRTRINGKLCPIRVTEKLPPVIGSWTKPDPITGGSNRRKKTVFAWVRLNPPPKARVLSGESPASAIHPPPNFPFGKPPDWKDPPGMTEDLSGDPAYDSAEPRDPPPPAAHGTKTMTWKWFQPTGFISRRNPGSAVWLPIRFMAPAKDYDQADYRKACADHLLAKKVRERSAASPLIYSRRLIACKYRTEER